MVRDVAFRAVVLFAATWTLMASGGGGGTSPVSNNPVPPTTNPPEFFDATSTEVSTLGSQQLNSTTQTVSSSSGSLDRANDRITIAGLSGSIDSSRLNVTLDAGGSIVITQGSTDYVGTFNAQPAAADPFIGVVGVSSTDAPTTGSATYSGVNQVQIVDGTSVYELTGSTTASVDFGSGDVDMTFANLSGTRTDGISPPTAVTNVAVIGIDNSNLSGSTFSGGTATFNSTQIATALSGAQVVTVAGGLYGPGGDELGGVLLINDTGSGTLLVQGSYTAD